MALTGIVSFHFIIEPSPSRTKGRSAGCYDTHLHLETARIESAQAARVQGAYSRSPIPVDYATILSVSFAGR
jgi:hypothetical protein